MEIIFNLLIVLLAVITFLVIYFLYSKREEKLNRNKPNVNSPDMELARELIVENLESFKKEQTKSYLRLMARDPECIFSYWQINDSLLAGKEPFLRLYQEEGSYQELRLDNNKNRVYFYGLQPTSRYRAEIGFKDTKGFHSLISSNTVATPAESPSKIIDQYWAVLTLADGSQIIEVDSYSYQKNS